MATVFTMSATRAPRDRSLTGLFRPCSTGPMATAPALRCTALYVLLPVFRSGKISTVAFPATAESGQFGRRHPRVHRGVVLDRPLDQQVRAQLVDQIGCPPDLVDIGAGPGRPGGVGQHGHPRLDAELLAAVVADEIAMSASCSAVGSGLTAQSP